MHELGDDHDWLAACDHAFQEEYVRVVQLRHDVRFVQQIASFVFTSAEFQRLHGHQVTTCDLLTSTRPWHQLQMTFVHVDEFTYITHILPLNCGHMAD